jgi:death on curing protein
VIRYLSLDEVIDLHAMVIQQSGGMTGFRDASAFLDSNKRIGHAAMETFLVLNGHELKAPTNEQEQVILQLAAGQMKRPDFTDWVRNHVVPIVNP